MQKIAKVHLFPTGRLGNQLYFAAAALTLRKKLIAQGFSPKVILHAPEPLEDLKYLVNFEAEKIAKDSIARMIIGKRTLQKANILIRFLSKLFRSRYELNSQNITTFDEVNPAHFRPRIKISESRHDYRFFEDIKDEIFQYQRKKLGSLLTSARINDEDFDSKIAVHMRFGDYLAPGIAAQYGNLSQSYYRRALQELIGMDRIEKAHIQLFSDDVALGLDALEKMGIENISTYSNANLTPAQELLLMSQFSRIIISNSTFSWWAGYFAEKKSAVVAPNPLMLAAESNLSRSPHWIYVDGWA